MLARAVLQVQVQVVVVPGLIARTQVAAAAVIIVAAADSSALC